MAGLAAAFGSGAMTNSYDDMETAGCFFVIGSNTTACHPLIARRIYDEPNHRSSHDRPKPRGGGLAVVTVIVAAWITAAVTGKIDVRSTLPQKDVA